MKKILTILCIAALACCFAPQASAASISCASENTLVQEAFSPSISQNLEIGDMQTDKLSEEDDSEVVVIVIIIIHKPEKPHPLHL